MKPSPPKWADRFLQWYCRPDILEEIQGDAYELYVRTAKDNKRKADFKFVWNVLRFFRWRNIRNPKPSYQSNSLPMFQNYLLVGLRNAIRNRSVSLINASGLALGVAGAITIFIYTDQFFHTDDFHVNRERIFEVVNVVNRNQSLVTMSDVPLLLGPAMKEDIPAIDKVVRMEIGGGSIRYEDKVFSQNIYFVDNTFFDLFTFPFTEGNSKVLADKNSIVFTSRMAEKYFGQERAVGKTISIKFSNNKVVDFTVGAVVDQPANSTMYFNFLLSMEVFEDLRSNDVFDWQYLTNATFIMLKPGHSADELSGLLQKYVTIQHESSPEWKTEYFKFYSLPSLTSSSHEIESGLVGPGHPQGPLAMLFIAVMLLALACVNYMNISVATVSTRLKEIAVRKVIGGRRREIVYQFITENVLLSMFSILLGLYVAYQFFFPWLVALVGYEVPFAFSSGKMIFLFFGSLLLFIVVVSGVYPAVYVSRFMPVSIFKGKERFGQRSFFSRALLTFQFMLAFMTIVGSLVFVDNSLYLRGKDWGYDYQNNLVVPVHSYEQYLKLRDVVSSQNVIESYAGSTDHIGVWTNRSSVKNGGDRFEVVQYRVGQDYPQTMNLRLTEGRLFDPDIQSDRETSVIVNENFVRSMGWESGLNKTFEYDSVVRTVVGVVKNFHYQEFYEGILPVIITATADSSFRFMAICAREGRAEEALSLVKNAWKSIAPDDPFDGMVQREVFQNLFQNNKVEIRLLSFVAGMALVLACLGLYGLVSYNITRRLKEFSVRKIFGANLFQIFKLMNQDYLGILIVSFALGAPAGFFLMDLLLHHIYVNPQDAGPLPFAVAIIMMLFTIALTVGFQMKRIARENPVETLRSE